MGFRPHRDDPIGQRSGDVDNRQEGDNPLRKTTPLTPVPRAARSGAEPPTRRPRSDAESLKSQIPKSAATVVSSAIESRKKHPLLIVSEPQS